MGWFTADDPINMGLFYLGEPDEVEHLTGVHSSNVTAKLLDGVIGFARPPSVLFRRPARQEAGT